MDPGLLDQVLPLPGVVAVPGRLLALSTAGEAAAGLPFGLDIDTLQTSVLVYLGLSSLAFVLVWVVGYLRSR
ncbi:MAG: cytochrome B6 [Synechococcaceae cyanobacterium]